MGKDIKGKELGEGILQRKNGRYEARYTNRFGKRVSVSGKSLKEVKQRLNEAIYENEKEINVRDNIRLSEWYEQWMHYYKEDILRETSKVYYENVFRKHIEPVLGKMYLTDITQLDIKRLLKKIKEKGLKFETQNKARIILLDMFDKAIFSEYLTKNPVRGITLRRDDEKDIRVLSLEEQTCFFECCKGTFYNNFFVTAITTGMRIGELAALKEDDIDFVRKEIHVTKTLVYQKLEGDNCKEFHFGATKTKTSNRIIPMNHQCELALKKQILQKRVIEEKSCKKVDKEFKDLLFTTRFNTPLNSQIICDAIKKIIDEINLTRDSLDEMELFSCHCLRHTFATRCFEAGIQPKTVQSYLGHATLQMTMDLYTAVLPEYKSAEMNKLEEILSSTEI